VKWRSAKRTPASTPSDSRTNSRRSIRINLACNKIGKPPSVILPSNDLIEERANFMIDTGSDINLIKKNSLFEKVLINDKVVFELSGITKGRTRRRC